MFLKAMYAGQESAGSDTPADLHASRYPGSAREFGR